MSYQDLLTRLFMCAKRAFGGDPDDPTIPNISNRRRRGNGVYLASE